MGTPPAAKPAGDAKPVTEGAAGAGPAAAGAGQASAEGDARFLGDVLGELQRLHELRVELDERSSPEELRRLGELGLSLRDVRAFESSYVEHCQVLAHSHSLSLISHIRTYEFMQVLVAVRTVRVALSSHTRTHCIQRAVSSNHFRITPCYHCLSQ